MQHPLLHPCNTRDVTAITDPDTPSMQIVVKKREKAGVACRIKDGSLVYVPAGGTP